MPGKDLPVITFDGESLLNVLLYGSDKFNDEIDKKILLSIIPNKVDDTGVAEVRAWPPTLLCGKK